MTDIFSLFVFLVVFRILAVVVKILFHAENRNNFRRDR